MEWKWKLNGNGRKLDGNGRKFDGNGWPQTAIILSLFSLPFHLRALLSKESTSMSIPALKVRKGGGLLCEVMKLLFGN